MIDEERRASDLEFEQMAAELKRLNEANAQWEKRIAEMEEFGMAMDAFLVSPRKFPSILTDEERTRGERLGLEAENPEGAQVDRIAVARGLFALLSGALTRDSSPEHDGMRALVRRMGELMAALDEG